MTATRFLIRAPSLAWTRREEPHVQHVSDRGKLSAFARPVWPQGHEILSIISAFALGGGDEKTPGLIPPGAKFCDVTRRGKNRI
jgi:hypothetical protein